METKIFDQGYAEQKDKKTKRKIEKTQIPKREAGQFPTFVMFLDMG